LGRALTFGRARRVARLRPEQSRAASVCPTISPQLGERPSLGRRCSGRRFRRRATAASGARLLWLPCSSQAEPPPPLVVCPFSDWTASGKPRAATAEPAARPKLACGAKIPPAPANRSVRVGRIRAPDANAPASRRKVTHSACLHLAGCWPTGRLGSRLNPLALWAQARRRRRRRRSLATHSRRSGAEHAHSAGPQEARAGRRQSGKFGR